MYLNVFEGKTSKDIINSTGGFCHCEKNWVKGVLETFLKQNFLFGLLGQSSWTKHLEYGIVNNVI